MICSDHLILMWMGLHRRKFLVCLVQTLKGCGTTSPFNFLGMRLGSKWPTVDLQNSFHKTKTAARSLHVDHHECLRLRLNRNEEFNIPHGNRKKSYFLVFLVKQWCESFIQVALSLLRQFFIPLKSPSALAVHTAEFLWIPCACMPKWLKI